MPTKSLNDLERRFICDAIKLSASDIVVAVLTEIFELNITDLSAVNGAVIDKISERLSVSTNSIDAFSAFFLSLSEEAKREFRRMA